MRVTKLQKKNVCGTTGFPSSHMLMFYTCQWPETFKNLTHETLAVALLHRKKVLSGGTYHIKAFRTSWIWRSKWGCSYGDDFSHERGQAECFFVFDSRINQSSNLTSRRSSCQPPGKTTLSPGWSRWLRDSCILTTNKWQAGLVPNTDTLYNQRWAKQGLGATCSPINYIHHNRSSKIQMKKVVSLVG